jgi:hypothetical protein
MNEGRDALAEVFHIIKDHILIAGPDFCEVAV